MKRRLKLEHDTEADALVIIVQTGEFSYTKELDATRLLDYDSAGTLLEIEVLYPSLGVNMEGMPLAAEVAELLSRHGIKVLTVTTP